MEASKMAPFLYVFHSKYGFFSNGVSSSSSPETLRAVAVTSMAMQVVSRPLVLWGSRCEGCPFKIIAEFVGTEESENHPL